jgi:hypothetical protein
MKAYALPALVAASVAGCAGLDITPISPEADQAAHAGTPLQGYVIYAPMVVVEVARKTVCGKTKADGQCEGTPAITCTASAPFTLPDPSKPFLLNSRSGFGKAGVEVTITNGWQLGNIKDNSDNTAILALIEKLLPLRGAMIAATAQAPDECKAGLYRVTYDGASLRLEELLLY